jgi:tripartite motif-containing protein 71
MTQRSKMTAIGTILALVLLVALVRNPVRHWYKTNYMQKPPSKTRFDNPEGLAIDARGGIYVGNQDTGRFLILDRSGKIVKEWTTIEGYHDGEGKPSNFCRGLYIVVPEPGRVIQTAVHNVVEFDARGDKPELLRIFGSRGEKPGEMDGPEGVSRDTNGDLYVTDEHNLRINVFDAKGGYLRSWSVPQDPQCVTVWKDRVYVSLNKRNYSACYTKDGVEKFRIGHEALFPLVLYVTIPCAVVSLVLFTALKKTKLALILTGVFLAAAGGGSGLDFARHKMPGEYRLPDYIAVSPDQTELYIVDRLNCRIQVTDMEGNFKRMFGRPGSSPGHLNDPKQLAFDPDGNLWVADSDNNRLQVFKPDGTLLKIVE